MDCGCKVKKKFEFVYEILKINMYFWYFESWVLEERGESVYVIFNLLKEYWGYIVD